VKNVIYYHASQTKDISFLEPHVSNHNIPLIFFLRKEKMFLYTFQMQLRNIVKKKDSSMMETMKSGGLMV